ncbi:MAG TPA: hypothetical protein VM925_20395 [Labilithrix sp.]|nr:hypothetical protein [Labilithrix sp.]
MFAMDGESLFFGRRGGIDQSNPDGSNLHPVFETDGSIAMVTVSPDGASLAIHAGYGCGLRTVPIAQAHETCTIGTTIHAGSSATRAAWSTNGLLAFADSYHRILVADLEAGSAPEVVLDTKQGLGGVYVDEVAWSPAGTVIP